ncbi:fimbria/pilus periplasmic chaperone [Dyella sp. 2HG41-7]|uniref:fimbrial biogenesis chaperone n=1 Tax=Dyella sp. 2HG41-7 TaxID=2883239 RepID=UPI001F34FE58|nr:fimbria/pilus periplasmic chaperone [Dyella sp. 2HG41-7]
MIANKRLATGLISILVAGTAGAAGFGVSPLRLDLAGNRSTTVEVTNPGDTPVDLEVQAKAWTQADGKDVYSDTSDLTFYPAKFTLAGKGKRVIRVTTSGKSDLPDTEKAYRLYITELPVLTHEAGENIELRERFGVPLFVHKPKASSQLSASVEGGGAGIVKVRLINQGTAHAHLTSIASDPAGIQGAALDEWYVLPGASHVFSLPVSGSVCNQAQAKLHIKTDQGKPVDLPISIPSGACKAG